MTNAGSGAEAAAAFDPLRPRLLRIAYRMLGSVADACMERQPIGGRDFCQKTSRRKNVETENRRHHWFDPRCPLRPEASAVDLGKRREELEVELIDLKDFDLPFFNEKATNLWMPSEDPKAIAWQKRVGEFDGYIFVVAEYNRSIPAALKNALDQAYKEWVHKPAAYVGYGSVGAARAIEHLRLINIELQMVPVRSAVHIGGSEFYKVLPRMGNQPISAIEDAILPSAKDMLDQLIWWTRATKVARQETAPV